MATSTATLAARLNRGEVHAIIGRKYAGLVSPGDIVRITGGWATCTSAHIAPDHAAVIVLEFDGDKPRRFHADETATVLASYIFA